MTCRPGTKAAWWRRRPSPDSGRHATIQNIMWHYVGLVRNADRLSRAIRELRHLQNEIETFYRTTKAERRLDRLAQRRRGGADRGTGCAPQPHESRLSLPARLGLGEGDRLI